MENKVRSVVEWFISQGRVGSQRELAQTLGYNPSSFSQILNGRVPLSEKFLTRLSAFEPRLNIEWVKSGRGEMLLPVAPVVEASLVGDGGELEFLTENTTGARFYTKDDRLFMTVKHVPFAAFGQFANDSNRLDACFDDWSEETYEVDRVAHGHYLSFEVKGDSMDIGTRQSFESGDKVLVRELERVYWDNIWYRRHPYWVVVFGSSVLIKQIISQDIEKGTVTFHSLNPSPEYADFTISQNDIRSLYYVIKKKPREFYL
ncbi:MAG: helix-turn-helix transcriptional regulator [Bacteroidales bacterium]|nr:helix-turn-helix transcriptional regulator [Bacteroidales bacterium]MBR7065463.1 helix-turn-helix transcriptional regulator [Prevotella sp.]